MEVFRQEPEIGKKRTVAPQPDGESCLQMLFFLALAVPLTFMFSRVVHGAGTKVENYLCWGTLIVIGILAVWQWGRESLADTAERKKWAQGCTVAEVRVLGRAGGEWDDGQRFHSAWHLDLEMTPDQIAAAPHATTVSASVSQYVYGRFEKRATVRIFYKPEAPLTFLLEEEI